MQDTFLSLYCIKLGVTGWATVQSVVTLNPMFTKILLGT